MPAHRMSAAPLEKVAEDLAAPSVGINETNMECVRALPVLSVVCWEHTTSRTFSLPPPKPEAAESVKKRKPGNSRKKCIALRRGRQRNFRANAEAAARDWSKTGAGQPQYSDKVNCS